MANDKKLLRALERRAYGYTTEERCAEYDGEGNELKSRVTSKDVPPDLSAIKLLLEMRGGTDEPSEEELLRERDRLLGEWKEKYLKEEKHEDKQV